MQHPPYEQEVRVTVGVDTHRDVHVAAARDQLGRVIGHLQIPTTRAGFKQLLDWASDLGTVETFGIEGTSSWGRGLCLWLRAEGIHVLEVDRPDRKTRRHRGKSDVIDAEAAAAAVQSGEASTLPKAGDGTVEQIRMLQVVRRSAVKARTAAVNQLASIVTTAAPSLRERLDGSTTIQLVNTAVRFRPGDAPDTIEATARYALRSLARRYRELTEQIDNLDRQLDRLVHQAAPELVEQRGIGTHTAATLLVCAGDNPHRLAHDGSFAHLTGAAPLDASSGLQERHRLNRGGDRQANAALHIIAINRLANDPRTQAYMQRRRQQGKTKREILRCLKRYIAREVHKILLRAPALQPA